MSKIDLSKANIGDKFRTRDGQILEYSGEDLDHRDDKYELVDGQGIIRHFYQYGEYLYGEENYIDLIEQIDNPLDSDAIEEEKQELERRQEVVELARKMLFDDNTYQFYTQFYVRAKQNEGAEQVMTYLQYVIDYAEDCVNKFNQYLKEGKL